MSKEITVEELQRAEAGLVQLRQQQQVIMTQVMRQEGVVLYLRSRLQEERDTESTEFNTEGAERG